MFSDKIVIIICPILAITIKDLILRCPNKNVITEKRAI